MKLMVRRAFRGPLNLQAGTHGNLTFLNEAYAILRHKSEPVGQPNPLEGLQLPRTKSMWGFATSRKLTVFRRFAAPYSFSSPLLA